MQSKAATVEEYLSELLEDRRAALQAVRKVILKNPAKAYISHYESKLKPGARSK